MKDLFWGIFCILAGLLIIFLIIKYPLKTVTASFIDNIYVFILGIVLIIIGILQLKDFILSIN